MPARPPLVTGACACVAATRSGVASAEASSADTSASPSSEPSPAALTRPEAMAEAAPQNTSASSTFVSAEAPSMWVLAGGKGRAGP